MARDSTIIERGFTIPNSDDLYRRTQSGSAAESIYTPMLTEIPLVKVIRSVYKVRVLNLWANLSFARHNIRLEIQSKINESGTLIFVDALRANVITHSPPFLT